MRRGKEKKKNKKGKKKKKTKPEAVTVATDLENLNNNLFYTELW